ncbi:N-acetyltransferase [Vibrio nigripulchritudo]|uniref:GNAT family N-acetyltransferase n=1 Tax=Vibrio nigripulchritudo TaxID=28173 RepID=UPI00190D2171|nr:GNAT family N-acetyltransferase [Vibrio nigripulchritudo]BCL69368.1 N-acetyltransferase [Vibrio nigripulchritudo]BDU30704.1 N-acetyltransferase [Vibrio nigripulchritudo]
MEIIKVTASEVEMAASLFDQYRVFYGNESDEALARTFIGERIANAESVVFLAKDDSGNAVGFTQLYPTFSSVSAQRSWILNDLYVSADVRGQGYGKALMNAAKDFAIETGAKGLALETAQDNQNAQKLYESLGYQRDEHYYSYFLSV